MVCVDGVLWNEALFRHTRRSEEVEVEIEQVRLVQGIVDPVLRAQLNTRTVEVKMRTFHAYLPLRA